MCNVQLHTQENPLPPTEPPLPIEPQDPRAQERRDRIPTEHAEEEHRDPPRQLAPRVPRRQRVYRTGDISRLGQAEQAAGDEEPGSVADEDLQCRDEAEREDLCGDPFPGSDLYR